MHLPIHTLAGRYCRLRQPGLYWLLVNNATTAATLLLSTLRAGSGTSFCVLPDEVPVPWLESLSQQGRHVRFFRLNSDREGRWFTSLTRELKWLARASRDGDLIIIQYPSEQLRALSEPSLRRAVAALSAWLRNEQRTLLLVGSGESRPLHLQLLAYNDELSGLASLEGGEHQLRYHIDHWRSEEGVCAHVDLLLTSDGESLHLLHGPDADLVSSNADEDLVLALRDCLGGRKPPSPQWQLFNQLDPLVAAAYNAHAATVVLGIGSNDQVEKLARDIHALRIARGNRLKIVLRELTPCLRHVDERLLFAAGTNLVVPYLNDVSRFLSQLQSVQGQHYRRVSDISFEELIEALRPQFLKGYIRAEVFVPSLRGELERALDDNISGLLVRLTPSARLGVLDVLAQCTIKRRGDFITVIDGRLYLFLFACRSTDLEQAGNNIFRLPLGQLFEAVEVLDAREQIEQALGGFAELASQPDYTQALARRQHGDGPVAHSPAPAEPSKPSLVPITLKLKMSVL